MPKQVRHDLYQTFETASKVLKTFCIVAVINLLLAVVFVLYSNNFAKTSIIAFASLLLSYGTYFAVIFDNTKLQQKDKSKYVFFIATQIFVIVCNVASIISFMNVSKIPLIQFCVSTVFCIDNFCYRKITKALQRQLGLNIKKESVSKQN